MRLISAKYNNFMGFGETDNVLDFDKAFEGDNTLLMIGIRDGNPKHSNGAGKSSIIEGICYNLFGRLPRIVANHPERKGDVAKEIIRTDADDRMIPGECYVELKFEAGDGRIWRSKRGRKVTKKSTNHSRILELECEGKNGEKHTGDDAEKRLAEILNFSFEALVNSCLFAQRDSGKFLSGTDSAKKDLFMELVGVQIVDRMLKNVRSRKSSFNQKKTQIEAKIGVLKDRLLESSHTDPADQKVLFQKQIKESEEDIAATEAAIEEEDVEGARAAIEKLQKRYSEIQSELGDLKESQRSETQPIQDEMQEFKLKIAGHEHEITRINDRKSSLQKEYDGLLGKVTNDEKLAHMRGLLDGAQKEFDELSNQIEELLKDDQKYFSQRVKMDADIASAEDTADSIQRFLNTGEKGAPCPSCGSQWTEESARAEIERQRTRAQELKPERDKIQKLYDEASAALAAANKKRDEVQKKLARRADYERIKSESEEAQNRIEEIKKEAQKTKDKEAEETAALDKARAGHDGASDRLAEALRKYEEQIDEKQDDLLKNAKQTEEVREEFDASVQRVEGLRNRIKELQEAKNGAEHGLTKLESKLEEIERDQQALRDATAELASLNKELKRVLVLEDVMSKDGFKTQVAKKYVPHMNKYANEFLSLLSPDLALDISMDGNAIKIVVQGANSSDYDMCSGGEQEAIRLAVNIANSMISIGGNADLPGVILLDEIFGSLDPMVRNNVFMLLERLTDYFPRIVVITHDLRLQTGFGQRLVVAKEGRVSRIAGVQKVA